MSPAGRTFAPAGVACRLPLGLQPGEELHHCRRKVGVVMDHLPRAIFPAIDVRDALLDGDLLSGQGALAALHSYLVRHVTVNE